MAEKAMVGLMIVEESVRAVEVRRPGSKNPKLVRYAEVPLPPGVAGDGEVLDSAAVALALQQLWAEGRFSTKKVVLGVGNRRILVRDTTVPLLPMDQIRKSLPFQVQDVLPVPADEAVLDFYPLAEQTSPQGTTEVRGLLVAAVADMVSDLIETVRKAGLTVDTVDLAPFGLARAAALRIDPDQTVLVAHVGAHTSYLVVMQAGIPQLVRIVPAGVPVRKAETGKHRAQIEELLTSAMPDDTAEESRLVESFATRVRSTVDFHRARHPEAEPAAIFVCGEGAAHEGVLPALERLVGLPAKELPVEEVLTMQKSVSTGLRGLGLVTPVGLALRGGS